MSNQRALERPSACALLAPVSIAFAASLAFLVLTSQPKTGQVAVISSPLIKADRALEFAVASGALILRASDSVTPGPGWRLRPDRQNATPRMASVKSGQLKRLLVLNKV
jgi:hypothetical protein